MLARWKEARTMYLGQFRRTDWHVGSLVIHKL